jgi:calcineurin-like phosphoesterase family protein
MKFYTADLHLDHANIINLSHRPFSTIDEMNQSLIDKWNKKVTNGDEVYVLGDFSWANGIRTNEFLNQLNGLIYLIKGNHDYFLDDKNFNKSKFAWIRDYAMIKDEGYNIALFHYPVAVWDKQHHGSLHFYGHVHNNVDTQHPLLYALHNAYNVGVDVRDNEPVTLREILK